MSTAYTYLWEFIVEPSQLQEFQRQYGADGPWVAPFRQANGYIDTFLLQDRADRIDSSPSIAGRASRPIARSVRHSPRSTPRSMRVASTSRCVRPRSENSAEHGWARSTSR
jgi:hypothetical protein